LLTIHHLRRGHDVVAAGFLVFVVGEGLILSTAAMDVAASTPSFGAGVALWAASLALVSAPSVMPSAVRGVGFLGSLLFAVVAVEIFVGRALTPLSEPLPFSRTLSWRRRCSDGRGRTCDMSPDKPR
jgi:hypothetical protein